VEDAGKAMNEIVTSVQRVGDIIGEISAAASEQSAGIGQVNESVGEIDRMTQQNAALVEQSAAAADSLREQATRLSQVVQQFRLGDDGPAAVALARPVAPGIALDKAA
jgi:methyl-accepting chemotaxis protein